MKDKMSHVYPVAGHPVRRVPKESGMNASVTPNQPPASASSAGSPTRVQVTLPSFSLGCAPFGDMFRARDDGEVQATLQAAWDAGVRHFDTAPHYGLGLSERRLGRFLAGQPRDEFVLSTKAGRLLRPDPGWDGASLDLAEGFHVPASLRRQWDVSPAGVRASIEESLERMGLDRVDVVYLHDPERSGLGNPVQRGMEALAEARAAGLARYVGVGSMTADTLLEAVRTDLADVVMAANCYTLLHQSVRLDVVAAAGEHGTAIVSAAVFNSGLLATAPSPDARYDYGQVPAEVYQRAVSIAEVCDAHGVELPTAALHYSLRDPCVTSVCVGAGRPEQVRQNVERLAVDVPDELWSDLADRGLAPRVA